MASRCLLFFCPSLCRCVCVCVCALAGVRSNVRNKTTNKQTNHTERKCLQHLLKFAVCHLIVPVPSVAPAGQRSCKNNRKLFICIDSCFSSLFVFYFVLPAYVYPYMSVCLCTCLCFLLFQLLNKLRLWLVKLQKREGEAERACLKVHSSDFRSRNVLLSFPFYHTHS